MDYEEAEKLLLSQIIRHDKGDIGKIESVKTIVKKVKLPDGRIVKICLVAEI